MTQALKTHYDTLTTDRRGPDGDRTPAHYLERWRRRRGILPRPGGGKIEKFRRIHAHLGLSIADILADRLPRVTETEYHFYRWNVGKVLCVYCGCALTRENRTRDHVVPRADEETLFGRGDLEKSDLKRNNLEPACVDCNSEKADKSLLVFLAARHGLMEE